MPGFSQSWSLVYRASGRAIWFLEVSLSLSLLELELLVGKSSFHRPFARSYLHVQKRSGSLLLWTTCFTVTPIHDLVYNSTNHEVNLYFPPSHLPPPFPPGNCSATFSREVSICALDNQVHYRGYRIREIVEKSKVVVTRAHMARRQFSARTECKWSVDEFIMEESVYPRGQAATIFCVTAFVPFVRSEPITRLDFPRQ